MGPRISFSNDFADAKQATNNYREAPVSSDFEFSLPNHTLNSADELFFKGKIVPLKENCAKTTLRDELLAGDFDGDNALPRIPKNSAWWKEKLGLKRAHIVANKKGDGNNDHGGLMTIDEGKKAVFGQEVYGQHDRFFGEDVI
ncbi:hypothetical protein LguiA_008848 [Lonicera macranthoides]